MISLIYKVALLIIMLFVIGCGPKSLYEASATEKKDKAYVLKQMEKDPKEFRYADKSVRNNREVALIAVQKYAWNFAELGEQLRDDEALLLLALKQVHSDMRVFEYASQRLKDDRKVVEKAILIYGDALIFANKKFKDDRELALLALKKSSSDLFPSLSPRLKKDREVVASAINKYNGNRIYAQMDKELQSDITFVFPLLKEKKINIYHLNKKLYANREVIRWAIENDSDNLKFASDELKKDRELVLLAIKRPRYDSSFRYADKSLYGDEALVLRAIATDYGNVGFLKEIDPKLLKKRSFLLKVLKQNGSVFKNNTSILKYMDSSLKKDRAFTLEAVAVQGSCLTYFDEAFQNDKEIVLIALAHGGSYSNLSKELKEDREIVTKALKFNGENLQYVPKNFKEDKKLILLAVSSQGSALAYAGKFKADKEVVLKALKNNGEKAFKHVDKSLKKDTEVVALAIEKYFYNINDKEIDKTPFAQRDFIKRILKVKPIALRYASDKLKGDKVLVSMAIEKEFGLFQGVDASLKKDKLYVLSLLYKSPLIYQYIDETLKKDREVALKALNASREVLKFLPLKFKEDDAFLKIASKGLKEGEENWLDFLESYEKKDYHLHPSVEYVEFREFLVDSKNDRVLSHKYLPRLRLTPNPLSSYTKSLIYKFENSPYKGGKVYERKDMNVFWIQRYVYRANMFVITKDRGFKVFNQPKDILWLLDGIDSEAELDLYLQIFDSFNIRGKYLYMKTKNGYRVKKNEIGYPSSGNSLPHRTYILEIDKQGKMEKKLVKEYTEVFEIPFVQPDPSFDVPDNMVQWLLSHRGFYDPR